MKTPTKDKSAFLKFNMDVVAKPTSLLYNDEVKSTKQAKDLLSKFMLKKK